MSETVEHPAAPPRFPFAAAVFCAACVGAAAWLWMRYSYCWDVTADYLRESAADARKGRWPDRSYVRFHGEVRTAAALSLSGETHVLVIPPRPGRERDSGLTVTMPQSTLPSAGDASGFSGRASLQRVFVTWGSLPRGPEQTSSQHFNVDTTRSRFTGESIAGLVVSAMGVFVFAVAFRHWLARRASVKAA